MNEIGEFLMVVKEVAKDIIDPILHLDWWLSFCVVIAICMEKRKKMTLEDNSFY